MGVAALALFGLSACQSSPQRRAAPESPPPGVSVVVQPGDTLAGIASAYGVAVDDIADVNGLPHDAHLEPGQRLFVPLPAGPSSTPAPGRSQHARPSRPPDRRTEQPPEGTTLPQPGDGGAELPRRAPTFRWPLDGVVLRDFTRKGDAPYDGILIAAPAGTPVVAAAEGDVLFAGDQGTAYGTLVIVAHKDELVTVYAHLSRVDVQKGAHVSQGDVLGLVGQTGRQDAPRLHFQVRRGRTPIDPLPLLPP